MAKKNQNEDSIIVLYDEDGNDIPFVFLDEIEYKGGKYVALCPEDEMDTDAGEVLIMQITVDHTTNEEVLSVVEDGAVMNAVYDIFRKKSTAEFDFRD